MHGSQAIVAEEHGEWNSYRGSIGLADADAGLSLGGARDDSI
jgi:hypothetical protein